MDFQMSSAMGMPSRCRVLVDCLYATAPTQDEGYALIRTPNILLLIMLKRMGLPLIHVGFAGSVGFVLR